MCEEEQLILVGFGKHNLKEILSWRGTSKEEDAILATVKQPPVYRRKSICDNEEIDCYTVYVDWISGISYRNYIPF
jgi:hypothetical protein